MITQYEMTLEQEDELKHRFRYHPPVNDQTRRYQLLRSHGFGLAEQIMVNVPDSRERSLALTKVEEAIMWANAAIARNEIHIVPKDETNA